MHVRLEPLSRNHCEALCAIGLDETIWKWFPAPVRTPGEMAAWIDSALAMQEAGTALPFAIVDVASGSVAGSTRYGNMEPAHRKLEIGWTWLTPGAQRTAINTEAKYLLLRYAFEQLDCVRVELKTDALNERSRAAILRIGAKYEGILRQHMITSTGRRRDSVYFSVIDTEWPAVKAGLESRLQGLSTGWTRAEKVSG
jgi:RimJ/RimL family protein N-acetyltransferase